MRSITGKILLLIVPVALFFGFFEIGLRVFPQATPLALLNEFNPA
jgi:hypothetical protein